MSIFDILLKYSQMIIKIVILQSL